VSCNRLIATNYRPNSTPRRRLMNRTMRRRSLGSKVQLFGQNLKLLKVCVPTVTISGWKKEAAEKWSKEKQLKVEAEEWKKSAQEHQEYAHQALLSNWALSPTGRKP
jgi:hypothetical protein